MDLRHFERREGEVLPRADVPGHRVIDVVDIESVRAYDIELEQRPEGWVLTCPDTRRPPRSRLGRGRAGRPQGRDGKSFEPLIGHARSARGRGPFVRRGRLKPSAAMMARRGYLILRALLLLIEAIKLGSA
ncbi:hypothetical protein MUU72_19150 [Streptomyces sp. RS10V-4]|uniref:hypothetical protein n=1 Tax=Streptomyces rhizoryzae TaxID=2932493 RepID=UPI002005A5F6|nr:hypothetical protein [Streptomyces rhizoryzae]MCK7625198.1 hypothetical protein [Streptomyces rhizoryzae]